MNSNGESSENTQGRICFVIMPFSASKTCTEAEWTQVFEDVFKPAVESVGYSCRRSAATRGSLIKGIIQDLDSSWVVLADLTDRNPNVFYELGVRHALKDRTILVAQDRNDIPFDLQSYANHIYNWRTLKGKSKFKEKIKSLLQDVDKDPDRADNPVSDFLESPLRREQPATTAVRLNDIESRLETFEGGIQLLLRHAVTPSESDAALKVLEGASPFDDGEPEASWFDAGVEISQSKNAHMLRGIVRRTVRDAANKIPNWIQPLHALFPGDTIQKEQIETEALKFEAEFAPRTRNVEQFSLGLASSDWIPGARGILEIAGSMISAGEGLSGRRFAIGLPAFFAWRLLLMCGARSVQEEAFGVANTLINAPIPAVRLGGQLTYRSLVKHRDLFYPEAQLGYANLGISQVGSLCQRAPHIQTVFGSENEFQLSLTEFLILVTLRCASLDERPIFPGYRLIPDFQNASTRLISRLVTDPTQLSAIAKILSRTSEELKSTWSELAGRANEAELGSDYWHDRQIPTTLNLEDS